jgi:hypothetical protein
MERYSPQVLDSRKFSLIQAERLRGAKAHDIF